jgi:hypothetical protein
MIWASKGAKFCTLKTEFSVPVSGLVDYHQIEVGRKEGAISRLSVQFSQIDSLFLSLFNLKSENRFLLSFSGMVITAELSVAALGQGACL